MFGNCRTISSVKMRFLWKKMLIVFTYNSNKEGRENREEIMKEQTSNEEPCRIQKFFENERKCRKGTPLENSPIIGYIYCGCSKCSPRY